VVINRERTLHLCIYVDKRIEIFLIFIYYLFQKKVRRMMMMVFLVPIIL
jgi:hypothetical protein